MATLCPAREASFAKAPKKPLALWDINEMAPCTTLSPTLDGSVGDFQKAMEGATTRSLTPETNELTSIVGFPTKSSEPTIL